MKPPVRKSVVLGMLMLLTAWVTHALTPRTKLPDIQPRQKLEHIIPEHFGDWRSVPATGVVVADPQAEEKLNRIYTEIVSRTYVDAHGKQIMLSVAYGEDQRDSMSMHYPEVCYPSQGFQTVAIQPGELPTAYGNIRVKRLEMVLGQRYEYVTYWTVIGEHQSLGGVDKKLNEMRYGIRGVIPDGLLFRVSSVGRGDGEQAFVVHKTFIDALLSVIPPDERKRLAGL